MNKGSQKSDLISTFLTSPTGNPALGIHQPGLFLREAIRWWSTHCETGQTDLKFLLPLKKDPGHELKLFLQLRGCNEFSKGKEHLRIMPGTLGVLSADPDLTESWRADPKGRYVHFFIGLFPGRISANFVNGDPPRIQTAISLPFTQGTLLERMLMFTASQSEPSIHSMRVIGDVLLDGMRISGPDAPSRLIQKAMQLILDYPCNPQLSVKWMAQQLGCHADYLSRRFHQETGTAFMQYVRNKRMEIAADLLSSNQLTVADVAASCGYRDHSYFTRIFHQTYGVVPSQWLGQ